MHDSDEFDLQRTAYHEAGHVVVALQQGAILDHATIDPPNDGGVDRFGQTVAAWPEKNQATRTASEICVSIAGPIAEMIYTGESFALESVPEWQADWQRAMAAAEILANKQHSESILVERAHEQVFRFLNSSDGWAAVAAIADLLLAHETIDHDQCAEVMKFWLPF